MAKDQKPRWDHRKTLEELASSLAYVFTGTNPAPLDKDSTLKYWKGMRKQKRTSPRAIWEPSDKVVVAFLFPGEEFDTPCGGVVVQPIQPPSELDVSFANCLSRVFNEDVRTAHDVLVHSELWMSLRQTQFRRAIARFSAFSTLPLVRWMQVVESSTSLRYEGKPFSFCVFMSKQLKWIAEPLGSGFIRFAAPLSFEKAILREKWIRAAVDGSRVGLLGIGHSGKVVGMIALPRLEWKPDEHKFAPHESLAGVKDLLRPGTMVFVTSKQGDVYMMFPNGAVFHKSQGRWQYLNYDAIYSLLASRLPDSTAMSVLRAALDLSYERQGALITILEQAVSVKKLVPDHKKKGRANAALRESVVGLNIDEQNHRQIIVSAATADGALILDSEGTVVDAACMICDPMLSDVRASGHKKLKRMPGARSTAAWNASIYGIAIKVSEDGPITIFENGHLIGRVG